MENAWKTNEKMVNLTSEQRSLRNAFSCNTFVSTGPRPTSVHALRPNDIEIVGAIGDSLTVCFINEIFLYFLFKNFYFEL